MAELASSRRIAATWTALSVGAFLASQDMTRIRVFMRAISAGAIGPPDATRATTLTRPVS